MIKKHIAVLLAYTLLALIMSFPLALNFSTAIPGVEGDAASYVWALGWARRALELNVDLFHGDYAFYPLGGATQLLWAVSLVGFLSLPLQYAFGLLAAHNALWITATVLTGYGTFLLANSELRVANSELRSAKDRSFAVSQFASRNSQLASFIAGLVFAFSPLRLGYGLAFLNLFNTQFIPFYILFLLRSARAPTRRNVFLAALFLGLNAYVDFQIAAFLGLFTALYAVYECAAIASVSLRAKRSNLQGADEIASSHPSTPQENTASLRMLLTTLAPPTRAGVTHAVLPLSRTLASIALGALVVAAPMLWIVANDFAIEGGNYIRVYKMEYSAARAYDLTAFFVPHARSALYADAPLKIAGVNTGTTVEDVGPLSPDRQAFLGYVALALAVVGIAREWRAARFWVFIAGAFALFSLGPTLHVWGQDTGVALPFTFLHEIPIINHIRIPMRYGVMVPLAVAVLAALGIGRFQISDFRFQIWRSIIPVAILLEYAILPYPVQSFPFPRVYTDLARESGDFAILEIPSFNWRYAAAAEAYQAIHGKRILRAYSNRIAPDVAEYFAFRGTPIVVRSLRILEGVEQGVLTSEEIAEDQRARDAVLAFYDLRYAILHRDWFAPEQARAIDAYLREVLGAQAIYDDGTITDYQLPRPQVCAPTRIDLTENLGQMYAGRGWQFEYPPANWEGQFNFVWARGARSEIYFRAEQSAESAMTIRAYATAPQAVSVWLNGARVDEIALANEWRDYRVSLPARLVSAMNRVELRYGAELREMVGVTTISIE